MRVFYVNSGALALLHCSAGLKGTVNGEEDPEHEGGWATEKMLSYRELDLSVLLSQAIAEVVEPLPPTKSTAWSIPTCPSAAEVCSLGFQDSAVDKVDREVIAGFVIPASLLT